MLKCLCFLFVTIQLFYVSEAASQVVCPPMPISSTSLGTDVVSEIKASAGVLSKVKAVEVGINTQTKTKSIFEKFPGVERLSVIQTMSSTYCSFLKDESISPSERIKRWEAFQTSILSPQK